MTDPMIRVRGARLHNLRDVDVDLPRDALVAVTGVSGSGKSSLAFGTIHGEAQRRYLDSVAPFARRLIHAAVDPRVRDVTGLPPTVALEQGRGGGLSSRSSVGTVTTAGSTLRMLWSRCGDYPPGATPLDSDHFSPNTAVGACPACGGLGVRHVPTEASMVPDDTLSIAEGAVAAWPGAWLGKNYRDIVATLGHDVDLPWRELPAATREWILFTEEQPVVTVVPTRDPERIHRPYQGTFSSASRYVLRTLAETRSATQRRRALRYVETHPCEVCGGRRLGRDALAVTWDGLAIDEASALAVDDLLTRMRPRLTALTALTTTEDAGGPNARAEAERVLLEDLVGRLSLMADLGLGHLALGRPSTSVSSGELQRLRLATALRSGLFGVVYVLDEPSAGLHPRDTERLLRLLRGLVAAGNTVVVVEHDMAVVAGCDWVVDVGPGAGSEGGRVLWSGDLDGLASAQDSVTAGYLHRPVHVDEVRSASPREGTGVLSLRGLTRHTVRDVDLDLPLGALTVVTGVSGSGKTSLLDAVHDVVGERLAAVEDEPEVEDDADGDDETAPVGTARAEASGHGIPNRVVRITQKPIGRSPRSTLATYTGLWDQVRTVYAATPEARARRFGAGRFSFNTAAGRCPTCQGEGAVSVELLFLPGTYSVCPDCHGDRFAPETLEVRWTGADGVARTVADLLRLTVSQAREVLAELPAPRRALAALESLGLGYLTLGQPATELSGGEAQRIKLATELQKERRAPTLYVMDEPTSGLHPADVHRLLRQLHALVDAGHTVVLAEHDPVALSTADTVVEMGPGAGGAGGRVVAAGART
ncbi:excinuclease ABC subunit A [Ornithinimicrobium tianjinense]|uniref:UvrABC system protein A n=2 Tax=Ornithinimicrobium tianjinense TaxID=1195761 RepID=A0A917BC45_9MICO|nr:excinuclease ABC subunit UvrA [Ornithinimicrobium tianjinense]GGF36541.1 excinuclease ABC subunit A [Ornithinimicrobium tianjinense]